MHKLLLTTIIILFGQIIFLEKANSKNEINCNINNKLFHSETKIYDPLNNLLNCTESKTVLVKNCWEEGDLASQKRYCFSKEHEF